MKPETIQEKMKKTITNELGLAGLILTICLIIPMAFAQKGNLQFHLKDRKHIQDTKLVSLFENPVEWESEKKLPVELDEPYKSERASYAYNLSGGDKDFVLLLNAECGSWNCKLHSLKYSRDGQLWSDYGLCGISAYYHTEKLIEAKNGDWKDEVRICYDLYNSGVKFYGWEHRLARGKNIIFNTL